MTTSTGPEPGPPTPSPHAVLDYVEIGVTDLSRARAFFETAFGWTFNDYGPAYAGIRAIDGAGEVGGLNAAAPIVPPGPGGTVALLRTDDLDAVLVSVERAIGASGGRVVEPPADFPGGRRFMLADPDGNVIGVYQPDAG